MSMKKRFSRFVLCSVLLNSCLCHNDRSLHDAHVHPFRSRRSSAMKYTESEKMELLNLHNQYRRSVSPTAADMRHMIWDDDLADIAQKWSENCHWNHGYPSVGTPYARERMGQNIMAQSLTPPSTVTFPVTAWFEEYKLWNYTRNKCQPGTEHHCLHYTQMAWSESYRMGCGMHRCTVGSPWKNQPLFATWYYVVCNYWPAGNKAWLKPFKAGPPCSKCSENPENTGDCHQGLCVTKDECRKYPSHCNSPDPCLGKILTCENWGTPDYDTCTCRCHPNFYGAMCEKAKCHDALTCENDGDFDPSTCTCACSKYFTGSRCEKYNCQAMGTRGRDSYRCARMPRRACTKGWHIRGEKEEIRLKYCPKKCGLC